MFTGIVREIGAVEAIDQDGEGARLQISAPETAAGVKVGDSVAVGGVCLTVTESSAGLLFFDAVPETLRRSSLGGLRVGGRVNVEPAVRAGEPLGGHIVQGHVDGVGRVQASVDEGEGRRLVLEVPRALERYLVEKGSVAVDGVSLTVASVEPGMAVFALVPHTLEATTLGSLAPGDEVNLEVDVVAKHVERLLDERGRPS